MVVAPGVIRDSILTYMEALDGEASLRQIREALTVRLGPVPDSSIRSYLNLNVGKRFERTARGRYRLAAAEARNVTHVALAPAVKHGKAVLYHADCFDWLAACDPSSVHAVITDPPYGLTEYSEREIKKLRSGKGGVWRIPPSFDGHKRSPLPRFTIMTEEDRKELFAFFRRFGAMVARVVVPGANVVVASNPLLAHIVASAMSEGGLELRGHVARLTMTMRGGDRPKNAHKEFSGVSVMPRSQWEPWVVLRRPLEGRVQDNLRKWKTGGFRRPSDERPFGDVIRSNPTTAAERTIAPHPSLKPQDFMRQLVRASLPLGEGTVLDPFAGSGSTLAAANAVGYSSIGVEADPKFVRVAEAAIPKLGSLSLGRSNFDAAL
ncbi:MAG: site-specific DNA-methyltransferase [Alphaproteobacteria bacterium]|nr:site-specific DNA-methyltransferase [Alphaproteobacteria bacterium]MBV9372866.1 site-specific DNA-methyltransferase [Alphaproteobacteria bacterium]MBV9902054.1 site-specific DNA-methyltransferase [Alphaproteobacteria bacterium]